MSVTEARQELVDIEPATAVSKNLVAPTKKQSSDLQKKSENWIYLCFVSSVFCRNVSVMLNCTL